MMIKIPHKYYPWAAGVLLVANAVVTQIPKEQLSDHAKLWVMLVSIAVATLMQKIQEEDK